MSILTITTDVQLQAIFRGLDERGDVVAAQNSQGAMTALTPLAAMELYEQLHAARNQVRAQAGLPEIATPDEGLLVLAFLRRLREEPAGSFREVLDRFDEAAKTIQMNRVEEAMDQEWCKNGPPRHYARCPACKEHPLATEFAIVQKPDGLYTTCPLCGTTSPTYLWDPNGLWTPDRPGWPEYRCPNCKGINDIRGWDRDGTATCRHCGEVHTEREWMAQIFVCDAGNGQATAEVR